MKPAFLALLLIVNLLMCPLRCRAHDAMAAVDQESAPAVCSCCSHCKKGPVSEMPEPCGDECGCENCICEGAVLEADVELSSPMAYFGAAMPALVAEAAIDRQLEFLGREPSSSAGQLLSGRGLRVSHQSWLL